MTDQAPTERVPHSNSYNIFILVLTVLSLAIMALLLLPLPRAVIQVLTVYDNVICLVFLGDFALNMAAHDASATTSSASAAGLTCSARSRAWASSRVCRPPRRTPPAGAPQPARPDLAAAAGQEPGRR